MTLEKVNFTPSKGLLIELDHLRDENPTIYQSLEQFETHNHSGAYQGAANVLHSMLPPRSVILDVGCGFGETSIYLASLGHSIHSVEPAESRCEALNMSAKNLQLPIHTYMCTGEELDKLSLPLIDGCLFFSSLHHCDDPLRALSNIKKILKPGGLILINEPILKFYRSKQWFCRQLIENPVKIGHYGGNEHIYYFSEYYNMLLSAGFKNIEFYWSDKFSCPRKTFQRDLSCQIQGQYQHSIFKSLVKYTIHSILHKMSNSKRLNKAIIAKLLRISLFQASFIAQA